MTLTLYVVVWCCRLKEGKRHPYVCTFCDEFLCHRREINWLPVDQLKTASKYLRWTERLQDTERVECLENHYQFNDRDHCLTSYYDWLRGYALSPRGVVERVSQDRRSKWRFSSCLTCYNALKSTDRYKQYMPFSAIPPLLGRRLWVPPSNHCWHVCLCRLEKLTVLTVPRPTMGGNSTRNCLAPIFSPLW